jgi:hypothetical protein
MKDWSDVKVGDCIRYTGGLNCVESTGPRIITGITPKGYPVYCSSDGQEHIARFPNVWEKEEKTRTVYVQVWREPSGIIFVIVETGKDASDKKIRKLSAAENTLLAVHKYEEPDSDA